jgi:hypothetical protein
MTEPVDPAAGTIATVVIIILLLTPLLIAGVILWIVLAGRRKEAARIAAMSPEERALRDARLAQERELREATAEYEAGVKRADSAHRVAYQAYQSGVAKAEQALAAANLIGRRELGRYNGRDSGILLYEDRLAWAPGGGTWTYYPLGPDVKTQVDTAGNIYSTERTTLTRMAAGGAILGKAGVVAGAAARKTNTHDSRELYLLVEASEFSVVVSCAPDDGSRVRQLASQIVNAGHQAAALQAQRPIAVGEAEAALAAAKADVEAVNAAHAAVEAAKSDNSRVEAARQSRALEEGTTAAD